MTNPYTPEKVTELVAEARKLDAEDRHETRKWEEYAEELVGDLVAALTAVSAERDRLHKAITEALAFESVLPAIATEPRRILRAALDKEGNDDGRM